MRDTQGNATRIDMSDIEDKEIDDELGQPLDSIEPIKQDSIPTSLDKLHKPSGNKDQVEKLLAQAINLSDTCILHEPTCILCSSQYREEVEQNFLKNKNYAEAQKLFKDKSGMDIAKAVVENHMSYHHDKAVKEIIKGEYVNRIKRHYGQQLTTLDRISICYAIITERIMGINSVVPDGDTSALEVEKVKSDVTSKLMSTLNSFLKLQAAILGEMKSSGEIVNIPTNDFIHVFNDAFAEAKTDKERELLKNVMYRLEALCIKSQ